MKTIKFKAYFSAHRIGSELEEELEIQVEDNATESDIEEAKDLATQEWGANLYELSHD